MIFVEHKNIKEKVIALNFCKGVGECVFEKSCQDGAFKSLSNRQMSSNYQIVTVTQDMHPSLKIFTQVCG